MYVYACVYAWHVCVYGMCVYLYVYMRLSERDGHKMSVCVFGREEGIQCNPGFILTVDQKLMW